MRASPWTDSTAPPLTVTSAFATIVAGSLVSRPEKEMHCVASVSLLAVFAFVWAPADGTDPGAGFVTVLQRGLAHASQAPSHQATPVSRAVARSPARPAASNNLVVIAARRRKCSRAVFVHGRSPPGRLSAESRYNRGVKWLRLKRFALAATDFRDAVRRTKSYPEAWCNLGVALYHLRRYGSAEHALRRALRDRIDDAKAWNNLGAVYAEMGQVGHAAVAFQVALTYDATCAVARRNLRRITGSAARISVP